MIGVEGYLLDRGRVGLDRQAVVWGDMVGRRSSQLLSISPVTSLIVLCFPDSMVSLSSSLDTFLVFAQIARVRCHDLVSVVRSK
jgi:hypothetical protein